MKLSIVASFHQIIRCFTSKCFQLTSSAKETWRISKSWEETWSLYILELDCPIYKKEGGYNQKLVHNISKGRKNIWLILLTIFSKIMSSKTPVCYKISWPYAITSKWSENLKNMTAWSALPPSKNFVYLKDKSRFSLVSQLVSIISFFKLFWQSSKLFGWKNNAFLLK